MEIKNTLKLFNGKFLFKIDFSFQAISLSLLPL